MTCTILKVGAWMTSTEGQSLKMIHLICEISNVADQFWHMESAVVLRPCQYIFVMCKTLYNVRKFQMQL